MITAGERRVVTVRGVDVAFRWVPEGRFWMGSPDDEEGRWLEEGPRHEVRFDSGFWMFESPCTQELWWAVMGETPSQFRGPNRPVDSVSWYNCQRFVSKLNKDLEYLRIPGGLVLSLLSEAQWEYACRAGTETTRYRTDIDAIAWHMENSGGETHPVGEKSPNAWGLYDMLGNVWEWCQDAWTEDYSPATKPSAHRVIRGGSWHDDARDVRAAFRYRHYPSDRLGGLGFRCAEFREGVRV